MFKNVVAVFALALAACDTAPTHHERPSFRGAPEIGPDVDLPADLDLCIAYAEICVQSSNCGAENDPEDGGQPCVSLYEDCSYQYPEAHEPACRLDYVWCKLELTVNSTPEFVQHCAEVFKACPTPFQSY